jgi:hypothetical protein
MIELGATPLGAAIENAIRIATDNYLGSIL